MPKLEAASGMELEVENVEGAVFTLKFRWVRGAASSAWLAWRACQAACVSCTPPGPHRCGRRALLPCLPARSQVLDQQPEPHVLAGGDGAAAALIPLEDGGRAHIRTKGAVRRARRWRAASAGWALQAPSWPAVRGRPLKAGRGALALPPAAAHCAAHPTHGAPRVLACPRPPWQEDKSIVLAGRPATRHDIARKPPQRKASPTPGSGRPSSGRVRGGHGPTAHAARLPAW